MASKKRKSAPRKTGKPAKKKAAPPPAPAGDDLLDMEQAIALLKTTRPTFYRWLRSGKIKGMKVGRQWRFDRKEIDRFLRGESPRIDLPADIKPLLETLGARLKDLGREDLSPPEVPAARRAVNLMLHVGIASGASDIHMAVHLKDDRTSKPVGVVRIRVDGVLHPAAEFDPRLNSALVEEWKILTQADRHEKIRPQDGRIWVELKPEKRSVDVRVSFLTSSLGESITARILDAGAGEQYLSLERTNLPEEVLEKYRRWLKAPWGLVTITGPTGCGKTSTIYAGLKSIARPEVKIITIEDPVEYQLPWMVQTHLRPRDGVGFMTALVASLRSDPDVVFVGELRDRETLVTAQQVALTGHLVLTALHAPESAKALARLVQVSEDGNLIAESAKLVIAQRLFRKLCPECSADSRPDDDTLSRAQEFARAGGLDWAGLPRRFREARGCPRCNHTGYRGRALIAEALEVSPEIAWAIRRGAGADEIRAIAVGQGMVTIAADGVRRACMGDTTLDEIMRILGLR